MVAMASHQGALTLKLGTIALINYLFINLFFISFMKVALFEQLWFVVIIKVTKRFINYLLPL